MGRGIRQGYAVSALLFIFAVEFLAIDIRDAEEIKGINLFEKRSKLTQYADDMTLTLENKHLIMHPCFENSKGFWEGFRA